MPGLTPEGRDARPRDQNSFKNACLKMQSSLFFLNQNFRVWGPKSASFITLSGASDKRGSVTMWPQPYVTLPH